MSTVVPKSELIEIAQFVVNPLAAPMRYAVYDYVVEKAIYECQADAPVNADTIINYVVERGMPRFPKPAIERALQRLEKQGQIEFKRSLLLPWKAAYVLRSDRKSEIEEASRYLDDCRREAEDLLVQEIEKEYRASLDTEQRSLIISDFYKILGHIYETRGKICVDLIIRESQELEIAGFRNLIEQDVEKYMSDGKCESLELRRIRRDVYTDFLFKEGPTPVARLKELLTESYVLCRILNCKPESQEFMKNELDHKVFILDTNILVAAIHGVDRNHTKVLQLLDNLKDINADLRYTSETLEEFKASLEEAREQYEYVLHLPAETRENVLNDLVRCHPYIGPYVEDSFFDWDSYSHSLYRRLDTLFTRYGCQPQNHDGLVLDQSKVDEFAKMLQRGYGKSVPTAVHDAFHLILVRSLRESNHRQELDSCWNNYWFLTLDDRLCHFDKIDVWSSRREATEYPSPTAFDVDSLNMVLNFFPIPEVDRHTYSDTPTFLSNVFRSHFPEVSEKIKRSRIVNLVREWIADVHERTATIFSKMRQAFSKLVFWRDQ